MKQFRIYLALLCAMLLTVGCSKDMETETTRPTDAASLIKIGDFPAFDQGPDTRATGTPDPGKTEWEDGDKVLLKIQLKNGPAAVGSLQFFTLIYNGTTTKWTTDKSLNLPDYRATSADITAYYAPAYEWGAAHTGTPTLKSDKVAGADEYLTYTATGVVLSKGITIDFSGTRPYSRLRVATEAGFTVAFTPSNATVTPAGSAAALSDGTSLSVEADANGNAFFYGTWTASEFNFTMTKGSGSFQLKKTVAVSVNGESYAVGTPPVANVDAATHTLELKAAGFLTADHIATALGGGTELIVSGTLNADDVAKLTATTSLTGIDLRGVTYPAATRTVGTVPPADWSGCTNLSAILINTADAAAYEAAWSEASQKLLYLGKELVHKVDAMTDELNKNGVPCVVIGITGFESHRLISRNPYCDDLVENKIGILGTANLRIGCEYSKLAAAIQLWGGKVATLDDLEALVPLRPNSFTEVTREENGNTHWSIRVDDSFVVDSDGSQYVKKYRYNKDTKEFTLGYQYGPVNIYGAGQLTFITFDVTNVGAIPDDWK